MIDSLILCIYFTKINLNCILRYSYVYVRAYMHEYNCALHNFRHNFDMIKVHVTYRCELIT